MNPRSAYILNWRRKQKQRLIEYKGGKCQHCGYSKDCLSAYDFHHRNPNEKDFGISRRATYSWEKLKKEVDKCDLLCKNCHAEIHEEEYQKGNSVRKRKLNKTCVICKEKIPSHQKFCSTKCSAMSKRKAIRPSKEQLMDDLSKMSWLAVGRKYGVSDNAVRKWHKSFVLMK